MSKQEIVQEIIHLGNETLAPIATIVAMLAAQGLTTQELIVALRAVS